MSLHGDHILWFSFAVVKLIRSPNEPVIFDSILGSTLGRNHTIY